MEGSGVLGQAGQANPLPRRGRVLPHCQQGAPPGLCVCVCVCVHVCVCICIYIYMRVRLFCVLLHDIPTSLSVCLSVCLSGHVCISLSMCVCVSVCTFVLWSSLYVYLHQCIIWKHLYTIHQKCCVMLSLTGCLDASG